MIPERAAKILNELLRADPIAAAELFEHKVRVNQQVCDHPTIQVRGAVGETEGYLTILGLLNGILQEGNAVVVMNFGEDGIISGFSVGILKDGKVLSMVGSSE